MSVCRAITVSALLWSCGGGAPPPVTPVAAIAEAPGPVAECPKQEAEVAAKASDDEALRTVDARASLALYEQLVTQDPTDPALLWKLALAYESQERWDAAATTFVRAAMLEPEQTRYWYRSGRAWLAQAASGDEDAYEAAHEPLEKCIEQRPSSAECHFLLGVAEEALDREQEAAALYAKAAHSDPAQPRYYLRLAELYANFRHYAEAAQVLNEGVRLVPAIAPNDTERCLMFVQVARLARLRKDSAAELSALAAAELLVDAAPPEMLYELGSSYALPEPPLQLDEARKLKAVALLTRFTKRVCRGARALDYRDACESSSSLLQRLTP